ncbi:MAG: SDR family NAD(P)-dependent oxidoreductase [Planctomycetaceae bacterium]|nr:SDR family NAD(P)-dependent oxidoreductase [Planctomycetaceae bacterium]
MSLRALVTGATGFLGQRLVRSLLEKGAHVRCLVRQSSNVATLTDLQSQNPTGQLEIVTGDLGDSKSLVASLEGIDVVYHLAAALSGSTASMFLGSVIPMRTLAEAAAQANVQRFVLVSSLGVYGAAEMRSGTVLDESAPVDPHPEQRDPYSFSKIRQEQVAREIAAERGMSLVVVRPGVIYGPGRPLLTSRVGLSIGPLLIRMGGRQPLPYTYVENCADAIMRAGMVPDIDGETVNVVDDGLPTGKTVVRFLKSHGQRIRSLWVPAPCIRPLAALAGWYANWSEGQIPAVLTPYKAMSMWNRLRYSNDKAKRLLGWQPRVSIEEGFRRTIRERRE